jgi:thiamine biosynthesis lipoprotein
VPTAEELAPRLALIDYRQIVLDPVKRTVFLKKPGMRMGLSGLSKGYIVDKVSGVLKKRGFPNHVVVAGGEVFASGRKGDKRWTVGILNPRDKTVLADLEIEDEAVTTSGNYERFFILDGVRYHHIIDPRTGMPSRGVSSATIVAKTAFVADSYDTACVLLGTERALALARDKGFEVFLFDDAFNTSGTPGVEARLRAATRK